MNEFVRPQVAYDSFWVFKSSTNNLRFAFLLDRSKDIVYGAGCNHEGQLATGNTEDIRPEFQVIGNLSGRGILAFRVCCDIVLAVTKGNKLLKWGRGVLTPRLVYFQANVQLKSSIAGAERIWTLSTDAKLFEIDIENIENPEFNREVTTFHLKKPLEKLRGAGETSFILDGDERLQSWGRNSAGECGTGTEAIEITVPTQVCFDYESDKIKDFVASTSIFAIHSAKDDVYLWGKFSPCLIEPARLPTNKKVYSIFEFNNRIVIVFNDFMSLIFQQYDPFPDMIAEHKYLSLRQLEEELASHDPQCFEMIGVRDMVECDSPKYRNEPSLDGYPTLDAFIDILNIRCKKDVTFCLYSESNRIPKLKRLQEPKAIVRARSDKIPQLERLQAPSDILRARSKVFLELMSKFTERPEIKIGATYKAFAALIYYLCLGRIQTSSLTLCQSIEFCQLATRYEHPHLERCTDFVKNFRLRLNQVWSLEELLLAYEDSARYPGLRSRIVKRMKLVLDMDDWDEVLDYAMDMDDMRLYFTAKKCGSPYREACLLKSLTKPIAPTSPRHIIENGGGEVFSSAIKSEQFAYKNMEKGV